MTDAIPVPQNRATTPSDPIANRQGKWQHSNLFLDQDLQH